MTALCATFSTSFMKCGLLIVIETKILVACLGRALRMRGSIGCPTNDGDAPLDPKITNRRIQTLIYPFSTTCFYFTRFHLSFLVLRSAYYFFSVSFTAFAYTLPPRRHRSERARRCVCE